VKVVDQNGDVVRFKVRQQIKMKKIIDSYCQRKCVLAKTLRFVFDGRRIKENDNPRELGIEDGDFVEVYQEQNGGFLI
jgi:small ubiquitin-related modifier